MPEESFGSAVTHGNPAAGKPDLTKTGPSPQPQQAPADGDKKPGDAKPADDKPAAK